MGAIGIKPTFIDLEQGFYDVLLMVKNGSGASDTDTMVFEIAKPVFAVEPSGLRLVEGETGKLTLTNGTAPYDLLFDAPAVASAVARGDIIVVKGMSIGETTLTVTDDTGDIVGVSISVTDDGIEMLRVEEFGEGFTFDYDESYDAGNGTLVMRERKPPFPWSSGAVSPITWRFSRTTAQVISEDFPISS